LSLHALACKQATPALHAALVQAASALGSHFCCTHVSQAAVGSLPVHMLVPHWVAQSASQAQAKYTSSAFASSPPLAVSQHVKHPWPVASAAH